MPLAARWCRVAGWRLIGLIHYIYNTMAIIRNAANTLMKGRVGQTTYYISKGQQVARQSRNDSNYGEAARRTLSQQERRILWANLVDFYKISARWMPKAFETKKPGQTDYNKFMAVNVPQARIALQKSQAEGGACVADSFLISQGSLPSIEVEQTFQGYKTNLLVGDLTIDATTTIARLSKALIDNNANIREDMQLSFVSYTQSVDPLGIPRLNCRCYEATLSLQDNTAVWDHIPQMGCSVVNGTIGTSNNIPLGGFAWILSELYNGGLRVSTQLLTVNNADLIAQFSGSEQITAAVRSYGLDTEVLLSPINTVAQSEEPTSNFIESVRIGNTTYRAGDYFGRATPIYNQTVNFTLSEIPSLDANRVKMYGERSGEAVEVEGRDIATVDDAVSCTFPISENSTTVVTGFRIWLESGEVLRIEFSVSSGDMG